MNVAKWFKERIIDEFSLINSLVRVGSAFAANMMKTFRKDLKFQVEVETKLEKNHDDDKVFIEEMRGKLPRREGELQIAPQEGDSCETGTESTRCA